MGRGLEPGDFAITRNGVHAMIYLGGHQWLQADPGDLKVLRFETGQGQWSKVPVRVMRWRFL